MKHLFVLTFTLLVGMPTGATSALSLAEKASLQAAMQTFIDRSSVNGTYLGFDGRTGAVEPMQPLTPHPVILQMGPYFVLCSDFRTRDGRTVNVDFYLARKGRGFVVFAQQVENHALVERLVRSGAARRVP